MAAIRMVHLLRDEREVIPAAALLTNGRGARGGSGGIAHGILDFKRPPAAAGDNKRRTDAMSHSALEQNEHEIFHDEISDEALEAAGLGRENANPTQPFAIICIPFGPRSEGK
jgi:hypothetical protein